MKTKNSAKGDNQDENYSQEELLNMDELFDLQGGIDDKQLESCGLGCFSGATFNESTGNKSIRNE